MEKVDVRNLHHTDVRAIHRHRWNRDRKVHNNVLHHGPIPLQQVMVGMNIALILGDGILKAFMGHSSIGHVAYRRSRRVLRLRKEGIFRAHGDPLGRILELPVQV